MRREFICGFSGSAGMFSQRHQQQTIVPNPKYDIFYFNAMMYVIISQMSFSKSCVIFTTFCGCFVGFFYFYIATLPHNIITQNGTSLARYSMKLILNMGYIFMYIPRALLLSV